MSPIRWNNRSAVQSAHCFDRTRGNRAYLKSFSVILALFPRLATSLSQMHSSNLHGILIQWQTIDMLCRWHDIPLCDRASVRPRKPGRSTADICRPLLSFRYFDVLLRRGCARPYSFWISMFSSPWQSVVCEALVIMIHPFISYRRPNHRSSPTMSYSEPHVVTWDRQMVMIV
jgi:hypothetical protein